MTAIIVFHEGGQFVLSVPTPQSPAPLRSAGSLRGNHYYHGRRFCTFTKFQFKKEIHLLLQNEFRILQNPGASKAKRTQKVFGEFEKETS